MNQFTTTKVKNGSIALPKDIRKTWQNAEVMILPGADSVYIKRLKQPTLSELKPKLKQAGRKITQKDINEAVTWAKQQTYQGSA
jgi:hypothetical protein